MDIAQYQREAHRLDDNKRMSVSVLGLVGEAGGIQSALKKRLLTKKPWLIPRDEISEELGDYLWYLASVCSLHNIRLSQIASSIEASAQTRRATTFGKLQGTVEARGLSGSRAAAVQALARVAVEIQSLTSLQTRARMSGPGAPLSSLAELSELITDALIAVVGTAISFQLRLDRVATENLQKVQSLFELGSVRRFDSAFPVDERIPRKLTVQFSEEITASGKSRVRLKTNDVIIGDNLTDNVSGDDGYRFHDVFHLAFLTILGWSPVFRGLLRRKRKSNADIDENEDGARAMIIEEAISLFLFQRRAKFGSYAETSLISHGPLNMVRQLAKDLEVSVCTSKEWQIAIHKGYEIFELLKENGGGFVTVDMNARKIGFRLKASRKKRGK